MAVCHPIAFADPKAVELDVVLQRVLEYLRAERPTAELGMILLQKAVRGSVLDLTLPAQWALINNVPPAGGASVTVTATRLETHFVSHGSQLSPLTLNPACGLKKALDVAGAAGFPVATLDTVQIVSVRDNELTWSIQSKVDAVYLDGQTCTVRSKRLHRR